MDDWEQIFDPTTGTAIGARKLTNKVEKISQDVEDLVAEELKDIIAELLANH